MNHLKYLFVGAILCDMKDSARGIIQNFLYLVHRFGYVPNGSRIYYLMRSQPPLLIQMAASYYTYTDDLDFIKKNIQVNNVSVYIFVSYDLYFII
jgi:alpha,alpha-trehalase